MSWDDIFYVLGAKLVNEFEQSALKVEFNTFMRADVWLSIVKKLDE